MAEMDDEYEIPLRDQRYFGAGLKRKRIKFVSSSTSNVESVQTSLQSTPPVSVAKSYLDIVLPQSTHSGQARLSEPAAESVIPKLQDEVLEGTEQEPSEDAPEVETRCEICHRPITAADTAATTIHHSSIAHQICQQPSYPPSHLDRRRKGLTLLSSQGWDPDSRLGLGAAGQEGILYPIKPVENRDRAGLGTRIELLETAKRPEKPMKLDAGKVRKQQAEGKRKAEKLREQFYRSEDVVRYLGND